jgi:hypothetical protein
VASLSKHRGDVRWRLGYPNETKLSDGVIDAAVIDVVDETVTEFNQTNEDWFLQPVPFSTVINQDTYNIDNIAPGFGKAHFVYTADSSDPNHNRRPIDIVGLNELTKNFGGGDPGYSSAPAVVGTGIGAWKHSARGFAFYYDSVAGVQKMVIGPRPLNVAQYVIIVEPAVVRPQSVQDQALRFAQFDGYVNDYAAYKLVHLCSWQDFDLINDAGERAAANQRMRQDVRMPLEMGIAAGKELLRRFKKSSNAANSFRTIPFGRGRN